MNQLDARRPPAPAAAGLRVSAERPKSSKEVILEIEGKHQRKRSLPVNLRIDTPIEIDYYRHGGILPFVLRQLLTK